MRRRSALGLVLGSALLLGFVVLTFLAAAKGGGNAFDPQRWLLTGVISIIYGVLPTFGLVLGVRELARIATPWVIVDERGVTLPSVGLIEWADIRGAEVVRPRKRSPRVRIEVQNWETYYVRQPRWVRRFDRPPVPGEARPVDVLLRGTNMEPDTLCDTICREADRRRASAA